ncbi:MAG: sigma-70 family RNA polymerase sigma factor [Acidobacteria bacterium]|nr:sigma-70 family RNA polymerase sigma factor [Acidobacteriota bacterium]
MDVGSKVEITGLLHAWVAGDLAALEKLASLVYEPLCSIARKHLRYERPGHTLETSALVHEAFFKLVDQDRADWKNRTHFFSLGARLMRRILVDHARSHGYAKRGGGLARVDLDEEGIPFEEGRPPDLVALDEALKRLAEIYPEEARVVELRFFGGMSGRETAQALDISTATVTRRWRLAKAWLYRHLDRNRPQ